MDQNRNEDSVNNESNSIFRPRDLETMMFSLDIGKILHGILRHIPLILLFAIVCALLGGYSSYRIANLYKAQAILIYQKDTPTYRDIEFQLFKLSLPAAVEMITLPIHLKAVKSLLGLDLSVEDLQKMISVEPPLKDSNLITISVKASEPTLAISIANTLAEVVSQNSQRLNERQWQEAYNFFKKEEEQYRQQIALQEKEIFEFRKSHSYLGIDPQTLSPLQKLSQNEQQLQSISLEYNKIQSEFEAVTNEYNRIPDKIEITSEDERLTRQRIAQIEESILTAQAKYASENPKLKGLENQLSRLRGDLDNILQKQSGDKNLAPNPNKEILHFQLIALQARMDATRKLKDQIEGVVGGMRNGLEKLSEEQIELLGLINKKNILEVELKSTVDRERAIRVIQTLGKSDIDIYEQASRAFSDNIPFMIIILPSLGFILGSLLGMGAAGLIEISDRKYRTPKELENVFTLPIFTMIPQKRIFKKFDIDEEMIFYIRDITERLNRFPIFPHVINITSATRYEGKTTIAHHLARYYVNLGKKVIILSIGCNADSKQLPGQSAPETLEAYLKGKATLENIVYHGSPDKISSCNDPSTQELINTDAFKKLMTSLRKKYDLIIIDAPSIIQQIYAITLIDWADATLFVIGSSSTSRKYVNSSLQKLEEYGVKPDGLILNKVLPIYVDDVYYKAQMRKSSRWNFLWR